MNLDPIWAFIIGLVCGAILAAYFLWPRDGGPYEQAADAYIPTGPTSTTILHFSFLTKGQVIKLAKIVWKDEGKITVRSLYPFMTQGEVTKLYKMLIDRELVTQDNQGALYPTAPLYEYLRDDMNAKRTKQNKHEKGAPVGAP